MEPQTKLLARDMFVTLSFHAKVHQMLDQFAPHTTPGDQQKIADVAEKDLLTNFEKGLSTVLEKIEKKELEVNNQEKIEELRSLKRDTMLLRDSLFSVEDDNLVQHMHRELENSE